MALQRNMYVATDETGRIGATTPYEQYAQGMELFEFPENFDFSKQNEYRIVDGELIHDPLPLPEPDPEEVHQMKKREQMDVAISMFVRTAALNDEDALAVSEFYEEWNETAHYEKDDIRRHNMKLWRCLQAHDAQADWAPGVAPSLWVEIAPPGTIPDWKRPQGSHDAYKIGDKVRYQGKVYESLIDANTYAPDEYPQGWKEVTEE